ACALPIFSSLAHRTQVLAGHMGGLAPGLAVAGVVDHQHPLLVGSGGGLVQQQVEPTRVHCIGVPGRLRKEKLQALHRGRLGPDDGLRPNQRGESLIPIPRQEEPLQILAKTAPLGQGLEQLVKMGRVLLQRPRSRRTGDSVCHVHTSPSPLIMPPEPASTKYRYSAFLECEEGHVATIVHNGYGAFSTFELVPWAGPTTVRQSVVRLRKSLR